MKMALCSTWCMLCVTVVYLPAGAQTIYVDADATGRDDGSTWEDAYRALSAGMSRAKRGDQIWVAEGTYGPITLKEGVKLYGGFAGKETALSEADPDAHGTYISGQGSSRAIECVGCESSTVVRGFHIVKGFIDLPDTGGGVYLEKSDVLFVRCVFTKNIAKMMGGAVAIWGGSPTFVNCRFYGNNGGWAAGAVFSRDWATPRFVNCLFYNNVAEEAGGLSVVSGAPTFINCTVADNHARKGAAGAMFDVLGEAVVRNCVFWNNDSPEVKANEVFNLPAAGGRTVVSDSIVKGGWPGEGNVDQDPLFVDAANGDFRIQSTSPCRDKGVNAALPPDVADLGLNGNTTETLPKDLGLDSRVYGDAVDMGAFEWHP